MIDDQPPHNPSEGFENDLPDDDPEVTSDFGDSSESKSDPPSHAGASSAADFARDLDLLRRYQQEIGRHPLLGRDEEREIARLARAGDEEARRRIIEANLRLVIKIAGRYIGRGVDFADLIGEGNLGLIRAVDGFDPELGYRFSTYATFTIRQMIERAVAEQAQAVRLPIHVARRRSRVHREITRLTRELGRPPRGAELAERLGMSQAALERLLSVPLAVARNGDRDFDQRLDVASDVSTSIDPQTEKDPSEALDGERLHVTVLRWLSELDGMASEIVVRRFGLDGLSPETLESLAHRLGTNREKVRQIQIKALDELRRILEEDGLSEAAQDDQFP